MTAARLEALSSPFADARPMSVLLGPGAVNARLLKLFVAPVAGDALCGDAARGPDRLQGCV
jgi:hypothetical protein